MIPRMRLVCSVLDEFDDDELVFVATEPVPGRSTVFYAVSDNADRIHDIANPFGWKPKDNSADRL